MTKGLQQIHFLCFAIKAKQAFKNSVLIGSLNQISLKVGVSDFVTRKQINYGLKNGLIVKSNNRYTLAKYNTILNSLQIVTHTKHLSLFKEGNFKELVEKNLFAVAKINFIQQLYKGKQSETIKRINKLVTEITGVKGKFSKRDYSLLTKSKGRVLGENYIVSGQKHLCKLLNISQGLASTLLDKWAKMGLIFRTIIYSSFFDKNEINYSLNTSIPKICIGSKLVLLPSSNKN
jgi:hypothetical protein